jgi:hypothetical protein
MSSISGVSDESFETLDWIDDPTPAFQRAGGPL